MDERTFVTALSETLTARDADQRDLLVFIHGYKVTFAGAAARAAQLAVDLFDLERVAFFSWPSHGSLLGYWRDEDSIRLSVEPMNCFLRTLAERTGARRVHVLVHSMGNRGVAMIAALLQQIPSPQLGEVLLAAPDVNTIEFARQAKGFKRLACRTTLYASSGDRALRTSKRIHDYPRAGHLPPVVVVDGVETVDVSNVDLSFVGHGYYAECGPVLYDMHSVLKTGLAPAERARLRSATDDNGRPYWQIRS